MVSASWLYENAYRWPDYLHPEYVSDLPFALEDLDRLGVLSPQHGSRDRQGDRVDSPGMVLRASQNSSDVLAQNIEASTFFGIGSP